MPKAQSSNAFLKVCILPLIYPQLHDFIFFDTLHALGFDLRRGGLFYCGRIEFVPIGVCATFALLGPSICVQMKSKSSWNSSVYAINYNR